jgi:acetyl-CoA C-acetyltransferase
VSGGAATDPRTPCIIGVARHTWHPEDVGADGAPEPLAMWEHVARAAADDTRAATANVLEQLDSLQVVYCQTWQYDDAPQRLAERLHADPKHRYYSGIGGTTPQQLVNATAQHMLDGDLDLALITSAEALATQRAYKKRGERASYSFKPGEKRPFPWEAPMHPAELAHEVFQAWLTFAVFDNARRARLGTSLDEYRSDIGRMMAPMTCTAARNPDAWFRVERTADDLVAESAGNRMVGYPYTKYVVSIMDVDMAAALVLATHERADALGVPHDQRVYLRGRAYATDPTYVAEHVDMSRSPAMQAASTTALEQAGVTIDDVAHLDLYSCFASSLHFAQDALGIGADDTRDVTVTGGLPYHGGPGSGYLTHSIATMVDRLRAEPSSFGMVSGVGMHMTKHVFGVYSSAPGALAPTTEANARKQDAVAITATHDGPATVCAYSVVHGRDGKPEWGLLVCDLDDETRAYAKLLEPDDLLAAEATELVGRPVRLTPTTVHGPMGEQTMNIARLGD